MKTAALAGTCLILALSAAAKKPRNPHWHQRRLERSRPIPKDSFSGKGWDPRIVQALHGLIARQGKNSGAYDPARPPIAALCWDDCFLNGDAAKPVFWRLVRRADFKFSDPFWNIVPIAYKRREIRAAYEMFSPLPRDIWLRQPAYLRYRKDFLESYQNQCRETGVKACRIYLARLWSGFSAKEAEDYATMTLNQEKYQKRAREEVSDSPEDRAPTFIRRGIGVFEPMVDLVMALHRAGFEIWVLSADADPVLRAALDWAGLPFARAGGIRLKPDAQGSLTPEVEEPLPFWGGEMEVIATRTGRAPVLSIGAFAYDQELLGYGQGMKILLDRGDPILERAALKNHWFIQPAFK